MRGLDPYERIVAADAVGAAGIYESNYLKANAPDGSGALWIKHNVLVPARQRPAPAAAEFWFVLWQATEAWQPQVWKQSLPLGAVTLGSDRIEVISEVARLRPDRAAGALDGDPGVSWDLTVRDELPPLHHFERAWMYERSFPKKKAITPSPRAVFDGEISLGSGAAADTITVDGWVGHRGHNWGTEHAHAYAYGNCNLWDDAADLTVDGATARILLGGAVRSPWLTILRGVADGVPYGGGSLYALARQSGSVEWPRWFAYAGGRRDRIRLEMELDPAHTAGLRYLHPGGEVSYCYNTKDARVDLLRSDERHTSTAGELEFLFPEPVEGVPLHGEASLEELADGLP